MDFSLLKRRVAEKTGISRSSASKTLDAAIHLIRDSLQRNEPVTIFRLGTLRLGNHNIKPWLVRGGCRY